jgi:HNH endonuclease
MGRPRGADIESFIKFGTPEECWLWNGYHNEHGYGQFRFGRHGKLTRVHIYMYEKYVGPIPLGYELHHKCEVKGCVNYNHLELLTKAEHLKKRIRTHCKKGHLLYREPSGKSRCPICHEHNRRRRAGFLSL